MVLTQDGTYTLFSEKYQQNYHNYKDGALSETLQKHIIPAFKYINKTDTLNILDICFGLGYNTFATIYYIKKHNLKTKINIYSPEIDKTLIESLQNFNYPDEFKNIENIIKSIITTYKYKDEQFNIELCIIDARDYLDILYKKNIQFNIVYQDAFSSDVNQELWNFEYFTKIAKLLSPNAIITTYSIATPVRINMYKNNLKIYQLKYNGKNKSTIASKQTLNDNNLKLIDMEHKLKCQHKLLKTC